MANRGYTLKATASSAQPLPSAEEALRLLRRMQLIRAFEEQVRSLYSGGAIPGLVHLCAGQEAVAVGVCSLLGADDMIASNHRGHGHCLAKGADVARLMAEVMGRRTGYGLGRSGTLHVFDAANGNLGTTGIVGGGIPLAAGAALSAKRRGHGQMAVAFFGDGALNQGLLFEVMNMAAIWRLPVLFVCENNGFGEFTAIEDVTAGPDPIARGLAFGIPSETVDGMDVLAVRAAAQRALERARARRRAKLSDLQYLPLRRPSRRRQAGLQGRRRCQSLAPKGSDRTARPLAAGFQVGDRENDRRAQARRRRRSARRHRACQGRPLPCCR